MLAGMMYLLVWRVNTQMKLQVDLMSSLVLVWFECRCCYCLLSSFKADARSKETDFVFSFLTLVRIMGLKFTLFCDLALYS